jgi:O-antigen/teichoic acid export membrane protein
MASIVGLLVNVGLNLWLIPRYSYPGAALATVITEIGVLIILVGAVRRIEGIGPVPWAVVARAAGATTALVLVALVLALIVPWPLAAIGAAAAFLAVLHIAGVDGPGGLRAVPHLLQVDPLAPVESPDPLP